MKFNVICFLCAIVITFICTTVATRILIPKLKSMKMGQKILDIGPRWHKSKEGTPTMGGLAMIFGAVICVITMGTYVAVNQGILSITKIIYTLAMALLYGLIGTIDDSVKLLKKQNAGLSAAQKLFLQLIVAAAYIISMRTSGNLTTVLKIPFLNAEFELGIFYYVFAIIFIAGINNSVNLTDGIDGLASSVTFIVGGFFAIAAFKVGDISEIILSAVVIGATLGFLIYNFYPAKIFMGDTGSLFLGGLITGLAFMIDNPLILVVVGFIYIMETLSVIIQVISFKLTKKRVFKMSPIHHHFEMCGWNEVKIVTVFTTVTILLAIVSYFGI